MHLMKQNVRRATWAMLLLLACSGARAADREARARALFTERCAMCHTVGQGAPEPPMKHKVDLTLVARQFAAAPAAAAKRGDKRAPLRDFLKQPWKLKPETRCGSNHLDDVQVELLAAFLERRAPPP